MLIDFSKRMIHYKPTRMVDLKYKMCYMDVHLPPTVRYPVIYMNDISGSYYFFPFVRNLTGHHPMCVIRVKLVSEIYWFENALMHACKKHCMYTMADHFY